MLTISETYKNGICYQQHSRELVISTRRQVNSRYCKARLGRNYLSDEPARSGELSPNVHANMARKAISVRVHATAQLFISTNQTAIAVEIGTVHVDRLKKF